MHRKRRLAGILLAALLVFSIIPFGNLQITEAENTENAAAVAEPAGETAEISADADTASVDARTDVERTADTELTGGGDVRQDDVTFEEDVVSSDTDTSPVLGAADPEAAADASESFGSEGLETKAFEADASGTDAAEAGTGEQPNAAESDAEEQLNAIESGAEELPDAAESDAEERLDVSAVMALFRAPVLRAVQNNVITSIEALMQDGSKPLGGTITQWQIFRLNAHFLLPDDVAAGDTTTIQLPEKLRFDQTVPFEIKTQDGDVVANAVVDGTNKTLNLTYTNYAETHSGTNGDFFFYVRMDRSKVDGKEDIPLTFTIGNQIISAGTVHFDGYPDPDGSVVGKSGTQESRTDGTSRAWFQINVNTKGENLTDVSVIDTVESQGITIDRSTLIIRKGTWVKVKGDFNFENVTDVTDQFTVNWDADNGGFSVALGDVASNEGYRITYYVDSDYELVDSEIIENRATLHANDTQDWSVNARITWAIAGGSAEGYVYSIHIIKEGQNGNRLAGAVFDVIRKANGATVGTVTTDANGEATIGNLLYGEYELVETAAPAGYELLKDPVTVSTEDFNDQKVAEKTISNETVKTSVQVEKRWVGPARDSATFTLHRRHVSGDIVQEMATGNILVLNADNNWQGSFDNLEKYAPDGVEYQWIPVETDIPGYTSESETPEENHYIFTNTNIETTDIHGSKTWDDNDDQDGARPESITIRLYADGTEIDSTTVTAEDDWAWTFTGLPKYADGEEVTYFVMEDAVSDYTPVQDGYNFTNVHTPGKTSVSVVKAWDDADDQDGIRPDEITVQLLADGTPTGQTLTLTADNQWTGTFTDLDEYQNGQQVVYTVEEEDVEGYTVEPSGDAETGFVLTNTHTPELTEVSGSKTWDDNDDQDGARPESITIRLYADGVEIDSAVVTAEDDWAWGFTDLPKYENGTEVVYSITEDAVPDYSATIDGYNLINTHTPGKTSVSVVKTWDDQNDKDGVRPDSVTIHLLVNGEDTGKTLVLSAENRWTGSFTDLDLYQNGTEVVYTVTEEETAGYTQTISGNADTGFTVKNSHTPDEPPVPPTPPTPETPPNPETPPTPETPPQTVTPPAPKAPARTPQTGDESEIQLWLLLMVTSLAAAGAILVVLRKKAP